MIGVIANTRDHAAACEFFELFKTPWEFYRQGHEYDVVLCNDTVPIPRTNARIVVTYGSHARPDDTRPSIVEKPAEVRLKFSDGVIPIYGQSVSFAPSSDCLLLDECSGNAAAYFCDCEGRRFVRIGYDLFFEVRHLLTAGQPAANAAIPTLEWHIAFLRELIVSSGEPLVEVSPVPEGYRFIACLTHDIDHPSIRWHGLDHTTIGFLYRAIFGSVQQGLQGRTSMHSVMKNWKAAAKLALIHLGLADDFWESFDHNYAAIEKGLPSSFFAIPFKGQEGRTRTGRAPKRRAARYGITDIRGQLEALATVGHEIGLHGIDAWLDSSSADRELHEVRALAPSDQLGVRMHWLYFDEHSPAVLDAAGADYDSTVGYNDTIGFRAGTTQVFKPFSAKNLLELPLDVMDTALFYPTYLNLSREEARAAVSRIIDAAIRFGGVITLNWHDRSLAPERLWGDVYAEIIDELREKGAWFATAGQAVSWFRMRRKATFETSRGTTAIVQGHLTQADKILPRLRVQLHNAPRLAVAH